MPERKPRDIRQRKWLLDGKRGSINEELDSIRSQVGAYVSLTSTSQAALLSAPSGKVLHLDTLIINNDTAANATTTFYDSSGTTTPVFKVTLGSNESILVSELKGLIFTTGIYPLQGSTMSQQIRVGCVERDAGEDST